MLDVLVYLSMEVLRVRSHCVVSQSNISNDSVGPMYVTSDAISTTRP